MNKRLFKKKTKQRFKYGINFLSDYCELSKETVVREVGDDLWEVAKQFNLNKYDDEFYPFLDSVSVGLMMTHGTGWYGRNSREGTD